jgi:hypothetical protein
VIGPFDVSTVRYFDESQRPFVDAAATLIQDAHRAKVTLATEMPIVLVMKCSRQGLQNI